jgi:hypothetical protein
MQLPSTGASSCRPLYHAIDLLLLLLLLLLAMLSTLLLPLPPLLLSCWSTHQLR